MSIQAASLYGLVSIAGAENSVGKLRAVSDQVNRTQGLLSKLGGNAGQVGTGLKQVAGGLVRVGEVAVVALLGAAGASAKVATSFQAEMELIRTQAGATQQEVISQSKEVQKIVHEVGTAPYELAKGLYHIESVGIRGAAALDILRAGALGAKTGLADVEATTNALTAVAYSGIGGIKSMTQAMGALDAIVGVGNMRLADLVASFGTGILGTAKTFGIGLREVGAALAVLTDAGVQAQPAATRMQMMFTHMAAPVPGAIKVLKGLGLSQFQLAEDLRKPDGIFVALDDLRQHLIKLGEGKMVGDVFQLTPQGTAAVSKIFGGSRFGAAAMQLLGMADRIKVKYDKIGEQQDQFGDRVAKTMDTARFKWGQFIADLQESGVAFGEGILPALARGLGRLDTLLVSHLGDIRQAGVDAGKAIDDINWRQVTDGAKAFVDILRGIFDAIKKIPPEIDLMVAGFLGVNKLSGGLLGTGIGNIVGGLGKGIANVILAGFSRLPLVGGAIGAVTAQRVFVVNWPFGFGAGGAAGAAGAAGGGIGLLGKVFLVGETIGLVLAVKNVYDAVRADNLGQAQDLHTILTNSLAGPNAMSDLTTKLAGIDQGLRNLGVDPNSTNIPLLSEIAAGPAIRELQAMRADVLLAISRFQPNRSGSPDERDQQLKNVLTELANRSGSPDERDALNAIAANTAVAADRLGVIAGIRIPGHVPSVAHLSHIGEAGDPFGFKHLKAFSFGEIPMSQMKKELKEHLEEINREIKKASARGDTKTVTKLQETKAGLEFLLGQVKHNTFHAGERAYQGALAAAAAADRTTTAVTNLPGAITSAFLQTPYGRDHQSTGIPGAQGGAPSGSGSGGGGGGKKKHGAMGAVGIAKMATDWMFGEAGDEGVAIIRNPRYGNFGARAGGGAEILIRPQPVRLSLDGHVIARALIPYDVDGGRRVV